MLCSIIFLDKGQTGLYIHMVYIYTQLVSCTVMFKSDRWRHRWIPWEHFVILWWQLLIAHLACLFKNWEKCNYHNFVENMNSIHWERNVSSDKNILEQWGLFKYWRIPPAIVSRQYLSHTNNTCICRSKTLSVFLFSSIQHMYVFLVFFLHSNLDGSINFIFLHNTCQVNIPVCFSEVFPTLKPWWIYKFQFCYTIHASWIFQMIANWCQIAFQMLFTYCISLTKV